MRVWEGGLQDKLNDRRRALSTFTPPTCLEPAPFFPLGVSLSQQAPLSLLPVSFQAQIFWNPSINTAGTQAAT